MGLGPYELGPNDTPENGIYTGDARELARAIPDGSVDLIFTDPLYDRIDDYRWLAETAARVLKSDRACLVWYGGPEKIAVKRVMGKHLEWTWDLKYTVRAKSSKLIGYNIFIWTTPCFWFRKGKGFPINRMPDTYISNRGPAGKHKWNKNPGVIAYWLDAFVPRDAIVWDPFTGGGTVPAACKQLERSYLAFEIDPGTVQLARERVRQTQPPLFVPEPGQMEIAILEE